MGALHLCPPAIAEGAGINLMTRLQVQQERRAYFQAWGEQGLALPLDWQAELEAEEYHNER